MVGFILMTMILMGGHLSLRAFPPLNVTDTLCRQRGKGLKYLRGVSCPPHHSAKTKTQTSEHTKTCKQKQTSMQAGKGVKYLRDLSSTQCKHKQPNAVTQKTQRSKHKQTNTKTKKQTNNQTYKGVKCSRGGSSTQSKHNRQHSIPSIFSTNNSCNVCLYCLHES